MKNLKNKILLSIFLAASVVSNAGATIKNCYSRPFTIPALYEEGRPISGKLIAVVESKVVRNLEPILLFHSGGRRTVIREDFGFKDTLQLIFKATEGSYLISNLFPGISARTPYLGSVVDFAVGIGSTVKAAKINLGSNTATTASAIQIDIESLLNLDCEITHSKSRSQCAFALQADEQYRLDNVQTAVNGIKSSIGETDGSGIFTYSSLNEGTSIPFQKDQNCI